MPVTFFIDPKMPVAIEAIALSYTMFDITDATKKS
jgi:cytochrome c oxidase assembly protein Cox11